MVPIGGVDVFVFNKFTKVGINIEAVSLNVKVISGDRNRHQSSKELGSNGGLITSREMT